MGFTGMLRSSSRLPASTPPGFTTMSAPTVRDAANSTSAQTERQRGDHVHRVVQPDRAERLGHRRRARLRHRAAARGTSDSLPVRYVPMLAPMTYIAKK